MRLSSHEQIEIGWGERRTLAHLRRTERRVLRIEVQPSGDVVVFAPFGEPIDAIRDRLRRKGAWIFRELDRISGSPVTTPERRMVSGETHMFLGRQYRLSIEQSDDASVRVEGARLHILARRTDDPAHCRRLLTAFYALTARTVFRERLDAVMPPFARRGLEKPRLILRNMSKRWGSYTSAGRIVLNIDLVRAGPPLIDYVICHELAHAFFANHGEEWNVLLTSVMPDWKQRKIRLEQLR
ncbi:M48 family metallopeptidase [Rhizobium bangladeshense]|uniref:M48 family metallopeptidase n=1 Tax=Rhizobium bangladeshense TaxID=1138189 RepID=UPI001C837C44|nr:M48 family metallopeptidase [Rhizobium bangladeshense]